MTAFDANTTDIDDDEDEGTDFDPSTNKPRKDSITVESNGKMVTLTTNQIRKGLGLTEDTYHWFATKITRLMRYTPYMTRGHIQMSLGPPTPPKIWQGPLDRMIEEGRIIKEEVVANYRTRYIYHLPEMPWPPVGSEYLGRREALGYIDGWNSCKDGTQIPSDVIAASIPPVLVPDPMSKKAQKEAAEAAEALAQKEVATDDAD